MVTQKRTCSFPGKLNEFLGDKIVPERQRSGVAQGTLRLRSDVAQGVAQVGSLGMILRRMHNAF